MWRTCSGVVTLCLLLGLHAQGQGLYGTLTGRVTDATEAATPGATVTATQQSTNLTRLTVTSESGNYTLSDLPPGSYRLTIALQGFQEYSSANVPVMVNQISRVDAVLNVGGIADTVTVVSSAALLQTDHGSLATHLTATEVTNLPLSNYRNFQRLYDLVPGATPTTFQNAVIASPGRALMTNVNGVARNNNNVRLDGAVDVFVWLPHHAVYIPPAETIDAVNVSTNAFDAEQGMAGGAAVTVITKSGTNDLRGSAFELHDNNRLKSNNFFAAPGFRQPEGSRNIFGGTAGGPVRTDRLFFFGSYEGTIERVGRVIRASVPTAALRAGDFSATGSAIYDPFSGSPDGTGRRTFPDNRIPAERISPTARRLLDLLPLPNEPGLTQNFFASNTQRLERHQVDAKVNWNRNSQHQMWVKYAQMDAGVHCAQVFGDAGGLGLCDSGYGSSDTVVRLATLGHTWTPASTLVIDGTGGFTALHQEIRSDDLGRNVGLDLGIPGTNGSDVRQSGMPAFFAGFSEFGNVANWIPSFYDDRSYHFNTGMSWARSAHDVRIGVDVVRHELNHFQPELDNPRGLFRFGGGVTALRGGSAATIYNQFAAFLLGLPTQVSKSLQFEDMTAREWQYAVFARDRWQPLEKLTVSYGLRMERYPLMHRVSRGIERLDWTALDANEGLFVLLGGRGGNPEDLGVRVSYPAVVPRLGVAYRLTDRTVVRGGYGVTIDPIPFARPLRGFYPLTIAQTFVSNTPFTPVGTLEAGIPPLATPDETAARVALPPTASMRSPGADSVHRGFIRSWNATLERSLPAESTIAVSYVGTATREALLDLDINAAGAGQGQQGRPLARFGHTATLTAWGLGEIPGCDKCGHADYDALQTAFTRPLGRGLLVKGAYTLSRAHNSYSGGPFGVLDDVGWAGMAWNHASVLDRNYGLAGYDRTHVLSMAFMADLSVRVQRNRVLDAITRGWQVNGIIQAASGTPFTVFAPADSVNAPGNQQVADRVKQPVRTGDIRVDKPFYAIDAWRPVTEVRFGNETRNSVRGPGFTNVDLSIFRHFPIADERRLEARVEIFNVFNTPRWENPSLANRDVTSPRFMEITASNQAFDRQVRVGARFVF
jgi:hypothetical protein